MEQKSNNRDVQVNGSSDDQKSPRSLRASPGEAGKLWWNQVSGWRRSLSNSSDLVDDKIESRRIRGSPDKVDDNAHNRGGTIDESSGQNRAAPPRFQEDHGANRVGNGLTEVHDRVERKSLPFKSEDPDLQSPQNSGKPSRKGAIDFIRQRTTKREEKTAEDWYRRASERGKEGTDGKSAK